MTAEEIRLARERSTNAEWKKRRAMTGTRALLSDEELQQAREWEPMRRWLESQGQLTDTTADGYDEPSEPYINTVECPNCISGIIINPDDGLEDECPVCQGSAYVLQTLGFEGVPVAEPAEENEPEHIPAAVSFIDYVTRQLAP